MERGDDDDSVVIDFDDKGSGNSESGLVFNLEDEFDGEFGYWLIQLFQGRTTGRKIKREILKFGLLQLVCGFALIVTTAMASEF